VLTRFLSAGRRIDITLASYRAPVPDSPAARAILLTGTMGSGKTAVTIAIGELLELRGQAYALVDLDWLGWVQPAPASSLTQRSVLAQNLRLIWPTFREAGVERLVLARYVEDRPQLEEFRAALPGTDVFVVRLVASQDVIERRLRARDSGAELAEHLAETARFAARGEANALEDAVVENGDRPLSEVAADVLAAAGWSTDGGLASGPARPREHA
jgi:chloramphenicol 3-O-phosphotransferase